MKNNSTLLKVGGGLLLAVLAFWLYSVTGAYLGDESDGIMTKIAVCGIFEAILLFSFFIVLKRDYPNNSDSQCALIFAGISSAMLFLSCACSLWANSLQESLNSIQAARPYDVSSELLESKEHFIYIVQKVSHYLNAGSGLLIVALVFALRLFAKNTKLTAAVAVFIFAYFLQNLNLYRPYTGQGDDWERVHDLYNQRTYIWYLLKTVLVTMSYVFLMFTYADKDNESTLPKKGIQTVDWIALATIFLTLVFFCKDWVCVGEGRYEHALIMGGYAIPLVSIGLIPIVWSVFSIILNNYSHRVACGVVMVIWPLFALVVAACHPIGDMDISLIEMADKMSEYGRGFSMEGFKLVNFFAYLALSIISGALILNGSHKPAASAAPVAPVAPEVQQEVASQE